MKDPPQNAIVSLIAKFENGSIGREKRTDALVIRWASCKDEEARQADSSDEATREAERCPS